MKNRDRIVWFRRIIVGLAALILFCAWLRPRFAVPVLMYHNIAEAKTDRARANTVSPASFERQMAYLKKNGYRVLSVDEYISIYQKQQAFPPKSVLLTFDDGYANNYTAAFPILKKFDYPALIFLGPGSIDRQESDPQYYEDPHLNWAQIREMAAAVFTVGSHMEEEEYLPDLSLEEQRKVLFQSRAHLQDRLKKPVDYLSYPIGGFSEEIKTMARAAGYKAAFATNRGYDRYARDIYEIKRIRVKDTDDGLSFWAKLSGYYNSFRRSKNPY